MIRFLPRPMRLSPLSMTRIKVIRKASSGAAKNPESGSEKPKRGGLRMLFGSGDPERRQKVLAQWRLTRRVDSGKKKRKGAAAGGVGSGVRAGGAALVAEFDVTARMAARVYRDLKAAPMMSG